MYGEQLAPDWSLLRSPQWHHTSAEWQRITSLTYSDFSFTRWKDVETRCTLLHMWMRWGHTSRDVFNRLTWYDSSPWDDVFINNVFSTLPSSDGRKISLKDAFPLGGITWDRHGYTLSRTSTKNKKRSKQNKAYCYSLWIYWEIKRYTNQTNTYSSVTEGYVKMSAWCKHWQQCHRNLLAGVVYIYCFGSC